MANMKDRVKGFEHTCQSHQLPAPVRICTELSKAGGRDIATKLFEHHVTGVFAINDELAIGCIRGLTECGKSVPDDLSVVGYDDIDMAGYMTPALTTIAQSVDDIVHISLQLITDKINGRLHENKRVELPTQLIQRETTRQL